MKGKIREEGLEEFGRFAERMGSVVGRSVDSILGQEGRGLCIELGGATMPGPGFGESNAQAFRGRVEREVKQVFPSRADKEHVVGLVARRSRELAAGLRRVMKENPGGWERDPQALRYLRAAGVKVEALNPAVHRAARTGPKGRVPKGYKASGIVGVQAQRAYVRQQRERVGLAKAGWYAAAKAIGGRVRRSVVRDGRRTSVEVFPAYVRRLARKFPDLGGAVVSAGRVEVFSNVRHAGEAMPYTLYLRAVEEARVRVRRALVESVRRVRGRRYGAAAA